MSKEIRGWYQHSRSAFFKCQPHEVESLVTTGWFGKDIGSASLVWRSRPLRTKAQRYLPVWNGHTALQRLRAHMSAQQSVIGLSQLHRIRTSAAPKDLIPLVAWLNSYLHLLTRFTFHMNCKNHLEQTHSASKKLLVPNQNDIQDNFKTDKNFSLNSFVPKWPGDISGYEPQERVLPSLWFCFAFQAKASIFQWYWGKLRWCDRGGRGCRSAGSEVREKTGHNFVPSVTGLHHCILGFLRISLTWPDIRQSLIFLWNVSEEPRWCSNRWECTGGEGDNVLGPYVARAANEAGPFASRSYDRRGAAQRASQSRRDLWQNVERSQLKQCDVELGLRRVQSPSPQRPELQYVIYPNGNFRAWREKDLCYSTFEETHAAAFLTAGWLNMNNRFCSSIPCSFHFWFSAILANRSYLRPGKAMEPQDQHDSGTSTGRGATQSSMRQEKWDVVKRSPWSCLLRVFYTLHSTLYSPHFTL